MQNAIGEVLEMYNNKICHVSSLQEEKEKLQMLKKNKQANKHSPTNIQHQFNANK
jgi:hypothetical protein